MSLAYRQTLSDELAEKVEETRRALGLSIQEITIFALAVFCEQARQEAPAAPPPPKQEYELTW